MVVLESALTERQFAAMKSGYYALWSLVRQHQECLERLLALNREINVYLSFRSWERWIDFQALIERFAPALYAANLFLHEFDAVVARNDASQAELITFGQQLMLEMKSHNIKPLASKFHKLASASQKQEEAEQASQTLEEIEAENEQIMFEKATKAGFIANGDGTVTDIKAKLMWKQCAEGQEDLSCEGQVLQYPWEMAMRVAECLNAGGGFAGYTDWRLPTIQELQSLVRADARPTICNEAFPNAPSSLFWSSTLVEADSREAYNVYFGSGSQGVNDRDNAYSVRLVRAITPILSCDINL